MSEQALQREQEVSEEEQIHTPILSVDESLSVEDRMTENTVENILPARYLRKDEDGKIVESPDELFHRVADSVATAEFLYGDEKDFEEWKDEFEYLMTTLQAMPNSPALMNMGTRMENGSACFVSSPQDSMESIFQTATEWGLIQKTGGGVGGAFHHLRPRGTLISTTKGTSSGPVSFMELYNAVAGTVKQGGKRRGAQMAILRVDHPDIGRFAVAKREEGRLSNFNISASITDEFKNAVEEDELYSLYSPRSSFETPFNVVKEVTEFYSPKHKDSPDGLVDENLWRDYTDEMAAWDWENEEKVPFDEKWIGDERLLIEEGDEMELPARFIWDIIIDGAWRNGEPGVVYHDEINREHSFDVSENPEYIVNSTNPCSEQPLCEYESCNLMHVNLSLMMEDDAPTLDRWVENGDYHYSTTNASASDYVYEVVDIDRLERVVRGCVRFLDDMIDASEFPLDEIDETVRNMRKIGVGVMGWAQMLYQMGIPYGSEESFAVARVVMSHIDETATAYSHELAKERGSFPNWEDSKYANPMQYPGWFSDHVYQIPTNWEDGYEMRNHNVTTVAPTGTTSMIADTSGGIEPVYNVAYKKNVGDDIQGADMLVEFDSYFVQTLESNDIDVGLVKEAAADLMDRNEFDGISSLPIPDELKEIFITSGDVTPEEHVLMQRSFQESVDSGISKTLNVPKTSTHGDVHRTYMLALADGELGAPAKGTTVYRDQSREEQVLTTQEHSDKEIEKAISVVEEAGYEVISR